MKGWECVNQSASEYARGLEDDVHFLSGRAYLGHEVPASHAMVDNSYLVLGHRNGCDRDEWLNTYRRVFVVGPVF